MKMRGIIVALALMLGGCVTAELNDLDERTTIISGRGTTFDNSADVARVVLARAATEAHARGYSHFEILNVQDRSRLLEYQTPVVTRTTTSSATDCRRRRCEEDEVTTTTTSGGQVIPEVEPGSDVTVRFLHAEEVRRGARGVWEAASVLAVQRRR
jgi:archaellin